MDYITYLKEHDNYDKYIIYLLELGLSITDVAKAAQVSRDTVYQVIKRHEDLVADYIDAIATTLQNVEEDNEANADTYIPSEAPGKR